MKEDDYLVEVHEPEKTSIWSKIKSAFNRPKALPDPNKEYTMDDWIKAQKSPLSRALSSLMESTTNAIQGMFARRNEQKAQNINKPLTPSQNFMSQDVNNSTNNIIIPKVSEKSKDTTLEPKKISVENIKVSEEHKLEVENLEVEDINVESKSNASTKENDSRDDL